MRDDNERAQFLSALDAADVEVTDWEAQFINSNLERKIFRPKQREAIDELYRKYIAAVKF